MCSTPVLPPTFLFWRLDMMDETSHVIRYLERAESFVVIYSRFFRMVVFMTFICCSGGTEVKNTFTTNHPLCGQTIITYGQVGNAN